MEHSEAIKEFKLSDKYILLVEDNPDDVVLTQMAFRKCRILNKLAVASDGEEALDLKIPCISGLDVLKQIRADKKTSSIPVVILTSSVEETDRKESDRLGANNFFVKPVDFHEFIKLVQQLSSDWLDSNECSPKNV